MNKVLLIGRLTADPEVRYSDSQKAVCNFSVALNRGKDKNGEDRGADFPDVLLSARQPRICRSIWRKAVRSG